MNKQDLLDSIQIGQSPITGRVYIGFPDSKDPNRFRCKSDFTERLKEFCPNIFEDRGVNR